MMRATNTIITTTCINIHKLAHTSYTPNMQMGTNVIHNRLLGQKISWHLVPGQGKGLKRLGRSPLFGLEPRSRGSTWPHRNGEPTLRQGRDARRKYKREPRAKARGRWVKRKGVRFSNGTSVSLLLRIIINLKNVKYRKINRYKCCMKRLCSK